MKRISHAHKGSEEDFAKLAGLFFGVEQGPACAKGPAGKGPSGGPFHVFSTPESRLKIHHVIAKGVPVKSLQIGEVLGFSTENMARMIGVSARTLKRKVEKKAPLSPVESDRLYRVVEVFRFAMEVFCDFMAAKEWLESPQPALGGHIPGELLRTEAGTEEVTNLLGRIKYGVIS